VCGIKIDPRGGFVILCLATHNAGKVKEFQALFDKVNINIDLTYAGVQGVPEPEETGATFAENALLKARHCAQLTGLPSLADDSGLCVSALNGAPSIHSARYAINPETGVRDFAYAMQKIWDQISDSTDKTAAFHCALAYVMPDGTEFVAEGIVKGDLIWSPRGGTGFGYDPFFQPHGYDQTFAEMAADLKDKISHRALAFEGMLEQLKITKNKHQNIDSK
jgi:XTP/dITP diphosphohydrolase